MLSVFPSTAIVNEKLTSRSVRLLTTRVEPFVTIQRINSSDAEIWFVTASTNALKIGDKLLRGISKVVIVFILEVVLGVVFGLLVFVVLEVKDVVGHTEAVTVLLFEHGN